MVLWFFVTMYNSHEISKRSDTPLDTEHEIIEMKQILTQNRKVDIFDKNGRLLNINEDKNLNNKREVIEKFESERKSIEKFESERKNKEQIQNEVVSKSVKEVKKVDVSMIKEVEVNQDGTKRDEIRTHEAREHNAKDDREGKGDEKRDVEDKEKVEVAQIAPPNDDNLPNPEGPGNVQYVFGLYLTNLTKLLHFFSDTLIVTSARGSRVHPPSYVTIQYQ